MNPMGIRILAIRLGSSQRRMTLHLADLLKARNFNGKGKFYNPMGLRSIDQLLSEIESVGGWPLSLEALESPNVASGANLAAPPG